MDRTAILRAMDPVFEAPAGIAFGRFQVFPQRRELLADGEPVRLGGRVFNVLMALIHARGAVLGKDALMARVWPDRIVEHRPKRSRFILKYRLPNLSGNRSFLANRSKQTRVRLRAAATRN